MAPIHVEDHSREAIDAKNAAIRQFLKETGLHLESEAKYELENDPHRVDTGLLRNSITHALDGESAAIDSYQSGDTDKYGKPVEVKHGSYSGSTPRERGGKDAVYIGTNVEYGVYV